MSFSNDSMSLLIEICLITYINMKLNQTKMIRLGAVVAGVAVLYVLFTSYSGAKAAVVDKAEELGGTGSMAPSSNTGPYMSMPHGVAGNATSVSGVIQGRTPSSQQTYQESTLSSSELLPNGKIGADWAAVNPVGAEDLKGQNFLQSGYHSNINIVGISQTKRNQSYDIRSELPNPQSKVGPFLNTTIDPDPFKASHAVEGLTA
jgi:hypothetical protein